MQDEHIDTQTGGQLDGHLDGQFTGQFAGQGPAPRRSGRRLLVALVLLLLIAGGSLAAAWQFPSAQRRMLGLIGLDPKPARLVQSAVQEPSPAPPPGMSTVTPTVPAQVPTPPPGSLPPGSLDARLALMEQRLARLDVEADAASGNAARAEGLLIAFAARRALDRGAPLGFLEDQLRLRFADAQPNAVQTLVDAATKPVTLDSLYAQLDALAPKLTGSAPAGDSWSWIRQEVSNLFIIRHQSGAPIRPEDRLARAKLLLAAGKIGEAVNEIERLPGAGAASEWMTSARRYDTVQRALDLVETTALLDSHRLKNAEGAPVEQPSPLTGPAV
jgi:hypothetical protein